MNRTSWNHSLYHALPEEQQYYAERGDHCSWRGCRAPVSVWYSYRYVTGRRGRIGERDQALCDAHAARVATACGLDIQTQASDRPSHRRSRWFLDWLREGRPSAAAQLAAMWSR